MIERIPDLTYNGILPTNALFPWYNPFDDKTYSAKMEDIQAGAFNPDDAWNPAFVYSLGDLVTDGGKVWISTANGNLGNPPGPASAFWDEEPDPTPPVTGNFWPLGGSASLLDNVVMRGSQDKFLSLGEDGGEELAGIDVFLSDGAVGLGYVQMYPNGMVMQVQNIAGDTGADMGVSFNGASMGAFNSVDYDQLSIGFNLRVNDGATLTRVTSLGSVTDYMHTYNLGVESGAGLTGLGIGKTFFATNSGNEQYEMAREIWSYSDPTVNAEDVAYDLVGSVAGALEPFLTIHGGTDRQFQVYGPLKLYEDATPPSAANHEGALIWTGSQIQFSDGATWSALASGSTVLSSTYTPTITNVSNVSASTPRVCQYMRVGNVVTVSGRVDITSTANNTSTQFYISLPIASNFASGLGIECAGSAVPGSTQQNDGATIGQISGDPTADAAFVDGRSGSSGIGAYFFHFTYLII